MKKIILAIISLIVFSTVSYSQTCPDKLKVGSSWEVTSYNKKGKKTGKSIATVKEIKQEDGKKIYITETLAYDKKDKLEKGDPLEFKFVCQDGKFYMDVNALAGEINAAFDKNKETKDVSIDIEQYPAELPINDTPAGASLEDAFIKFTTTHDNSLLPPMETKCTLTNRKVLAIEEVETPAGTYKCHKISCDVIMKTSFLTFKSKVIDWYYDGSLPIRTEVYNKKGKLLFYNVLTAVNY
ncbi:hypothetical protein C7377_0330 [Balneicella halophila]|uniref:DUF3108 domain-containing protein n=1 Tax=Balneicella halophila TaxID=1537566 RepID=A0A7L4UQI1_BALHA|nr:hypothetical protein [Balneicella halophila]PVX52035.1 hypothetical protein C7377_0330 [Balneicella halophila]